MNVLTICNPYPNLICLPTDDPRHKRVENRTWCTSYRGPLAIHAGKSRDWLDVHPRHPDLDINGIPLAEMVFGAIVCVVDMIDCISMELIRKHEQRGGCLKSSLQWMLDHPHTHGPWCHVYANPRVLRKPIACRGSRKFWEIDDGSINKALEDAEYPDSKIVRQMNVLRKEGVL